MKWRFNSKAYLERELYIGISGIILGIFFLCAPDRNQDLYRIYPGVVFWGLIVSGAAMVISALFFNASNTMGKARINGFEILLIGILLSSRLLIGSLGLYSTVFLITFITSVLVKKDRSMISLIKTLIFNLVLIVILYFAFAVLLKVNAPTAWLI